MLHTPLVEFNSRSDRDKKIYSITLTNKVMLDADPPNLAHHFKLTVSNYYPKKLPFGCLTGLWIHL